MDQCAANLLIHCMNTLVVDVPPEPYYTMGTWLERKAGQRKKKLVSEQDGQVKIE